jgi:hypothetical protein
VCSSSTKSWLACLGLRYSQTSLERVQDNIIHFIKDPYNILNQAGSNLGYKHKAETLDKFNTRKFSK